MPYINCKYCISLNIGYLHLYVPFISFIMGEGEEELTGLKYGSDTKMPYYFRVVPL